MGITLLTLLIVAAGVIGYLHFSSRKEEETPIIPQPSIQPDTVLGNNTTYVASYPETAEPEFLFFYSGDQIHRLGKDYKWNPFLKKYEEVSLSVTVSASESIDVQNNLTFDNTITNVESQITDAVTTKPAKPKKKRGRKPTKKVKK